MIFPGRIYGDHTDDFARLSLTQPVDGIREVLRRMSEVVASSRTERSDS